MWYNSPFSRDFGDLSGASWQRLPAPTPGCPQGWVSLVATRFCPPRRSPNAANDTAPSFCLPYPRSPRPKTHDGTTTPHRPNAIHATRNAADHDSKPNVFSRVIVPQHHWHTICILYALLVAMRVDATSAYEHGLWVSACAQLHSQPLQEQRVVGHPVCHSIRKSTLNHWH